MSDDSSDQNIEEFSDLQLTKLEYIQGWTVNLFLRICDNIFPIVLSTILACIVAFISSNFDHLIRLFISVIETIGGFKYITSVLFLCLAAVVVQVINPTARGSGIPEMKLFISNWESPRMIDYLSFKATLVKIIGLGLAICSGFPIGKEGPFVHISCAVAYFFKFAFLPKFYSLLSCNCRLWARLCNFSICKMVKQHLLMRSLQYRRNVDVHQFLCTGCALGVACTFGAPIGGVMFSIEVTSQLFNITHYWHCFYTGLAGALFFRFFIGGIFHESWFFKPYLKSNLPGEEYEFYHFVVYIGIGIASGLLGSIFILVYFVFFKCGQVIYRILNFWLRKLSNKNTFKWSIFHPRTSSRRIVVSLMFTLLVSMLLCVGDFIQQSDFNIPLSQHGQLALFFDDGERLMKAFRVNLGVNDSNLSGGRVQEIDLGLNFKNYLMPMLLFLLMKILFFCPLITCLPVPNGIFFPLVIVGACLGRLLGDLTKISSAGCAIVGAAGLSGAVTHTVSTAVIIMEMTEEIQYLIPCAVAAFTGKLVAQIVAKYSIYDMIMRNRQMPYIPDEDEDVFPIFNRATAKSFVTSGNFIMLKPDAVCAYGNGVQTRAAVAVGTSLSRLVLYRGDRQQALLSSSSNEDLRQVLTIVHSNKGEMQWKLIPVLERTVDRSDGVGSETLLGYIRCEAAEAYLAHRCGQLCDDNPTTSDWWSPEHDPDLQTPGEGSDGDSRGGCCRRWCVKTRLEHTGRAWAKFLASDIVWSELLQEKPCSVTLNTRLPAIQDFVHRSHLPQVFVMDRWRLVGIITRENIIEQIKKLHRQFGGQAVAYRGDLVSLPMKVMNTPSKLSSSGDGTSAAVVARPPRSSRRQLGSNNNKGVYSRLPIRDE